MLGELKSNSEFLPYRVTSSLGFSLISQLCDRLVVYPVFGLFNSVNCIQSNRGVRSQDDRVARDFIAQ